MVVSLVITAVLLRAERQTPRNNFGARSPLPLPSTFLPERLPEFQKKLSEFLQHGDYLRLGWSEDKGLRDTGPFIRTFSFGVHPTVKIYYSPEIMNWLVADRAGAIPDGAMIIKEQYTPPAAQYQLKTPDPVTDWTIMIKDAKGSKDGWYWAEIWKDQTIDSHNPPYSVPNAGFGLYCVRCHTSAERDFTFVSLTNIKGFPGQPLSYFVDFSWAPKASPTPDVARAGKRPPASEPTPSEIHIGGRPMSHHEMLALLAPAKEPALPLLRASPTPNPAFIKFFNSIPAVPLSDVKKIPSETYDHVIASPQGPQHFLTSDSCMGCHSAIYYGNAMVYTGAKDAEGRAPLMNVSPYGEWRWSPMGLAGRDPIFYSQLDSELAYLKTFKDKDEGEKLAREVVNTCFRCHGVMGKRQFDLDHGPNANFDREFVYETQMKDPNFKYGALARDGVSCAACHHIVEDKTPKGVPPLKHFLQHSITGQFEVGKADEMLGPYGTLAHGKDLIFTINGGDRLTSQSNSVTSSTSGITGLSVTALKEGGSTALAISSDRSKITTAITSFVDEYNKAQSLIDSQTASSTDAKGKVTAGILAGESAADEHDNRTTVVPRQTMVCVRSPEGFVALTFCRPISPPQSIAAKRRTRTRSS
jgi:mono/diheme cytochrome c family protein